MFVNKVRGVVEEKRHTKAAKCGYHCTFW